MKGSLIVVAFFIAGVALGRIDSVTSWAMGGEMGFVALCGLLLCVGIGIGINPDMKNDIKSLNMRMALLPVTTIIGSWLGAVVAWGIMNNDILTIWLQRPIADYLAVDSGFAYYSLSSIFITEYRGAELGTIALLANIIREMYTLLLSPLIAKWFGPLAPISAGGATTMDTTLPIITQTVGTRYTALSIYHGFVVDFSVPFVVTMWCTMAA